MLATALLPFLVAQNLRQEIGVRYMITCYIIGAVRVLLLLLMKIIRCLERYRKGRPARTPESPERQGLTFSEGLAPMKMANAKWGYVALTRRGKLAVRARG